LEQVGWQQVPGFTLVGLGCVLMVAGVTSSNPIASALSNRVFRYFGKVSFGIYVYHVIALALGKRLLQFLGSDNCWLQVGVSFALTLAMASLSYELYEKRFLRLKERFSAIKSRPV